MMTTLIRAKLSNKIDLSYRKLAPLILLYIVLVLFIFSILSQNMAYLHSTKDVVSLLFFPFLFSLSFIFAFLVPLEDIQNNYEDEIHKKMAIAGGALAATAIVGDAIQNKTVKETAKGALLTVGIFTLMNLISFKRPPWSYINLIFTIFVVGSLIIFIFAYLYETLS